MQNELLCVDDDDDEETRWWCCKARWVPYVAANNTRDSAGGPYREAGAPYKDHGPPLSPHTRHVGGRLPEKTWEECTLLPKKPPSPKFSLLQYCLTMQIREERILFLTYIQYNKSNMFWSMTNQFLTHFYKWWESSRALGGSQQSKEASISFLRKSSNLKMVRLNSKLNSKLNLR